MKKTFIIVVSVIVVIIGIYMVLSEDQQNKISRGAVSYLNGDYKVTYAAGSHVKTWTIRGGKVTSEPSKGYYFFWAKDANGKKLYVQTPIERTYIEEF